MKICLLCEGSYPYVQGGVSSWVQQLIQSFPQHEFVLYCINPDSEIKGSYKYELPDNLTGIQDVFLKDAYIDRSNTGLGEIPQCEQVFLSDRGGSVRKRV